ncbi:MAG: hypothetical protein RMJ75_07460, partial [Nitrososphaerota archaeon]|nr:hypothetical protein [Nitrososphaerota archaeon]
AVLQMFDRGHSRRNTASQVLILLAYSIVRKKHPIYYAVFQRYYERFKHEGRKPMWRAVLRVANQVAKDIHRIAVETQTTPR